MDLDGLFGKTIWIRLTKDADGFVSTVGYGPLFRRSTTWMMETGDEVDWGAIVDDASYSDE